MAKYDVIIKNGTVFDGKGNEGKEIDIGVKDGIIEEIGDLKNDSADKIIDANGKYVSPGFIDLTNHSDTHWSIFQHPSQESLIRQGITTIIGGNCGLSLAPLLKIKNIEGIEKWVDVSKININWQTMEDFFSEMGKHKLGVNFCTLVGFNTLHRAIMGNETDAPSEKQINQIKLLFEKTIKAGVFGISTSFGSVYAPSFSEKEIVEVLKTAAENGVIAKHHLEDEGKNILPSVSRVIGLARESKVKTHISHLKALGKTGWGYFKNALEVVERGQNEGLEITCDFFPYTRTGSSLFMFLPPWTRKAGPVEILEILRARDSKKRNDILHYLKDMTLHYEKITVASALRKLENIGKTIAEMSEYSGLPGEEIILELLEANNLQVSIFSEVISEENIKELAAKEYSAIASDGVGYDINIKYEISSIKSDLPHPRSFGAFPRAMRIFARENKILSWEKIIHKMTGLPAEILSLKNRGVIEKNGFADIVVFNPETIADRADYYSPMKFSEGISDVLVNGEIVFDGNKLTGKITGKILKNK